MEGKMIYLLFRQNIDDGGMTLIAAHATYDGVKDHLQSIEGFCERAGMPFTKGSDGSLTTSDLSAKDYKWYFFVSSRIIEK